MRRQDFCNLLWFKADGVFRGYRGEDPNQAPLIEPVSDVLSEEWKRIEEQRKGDQRVGIISGARVFSSIMEWSNRQLLLGIRTGRLESFRLITITIDSATGEEVGPRIVVEKPDYWKVFLLWDEYLALFNHQQSTVDIFIRPIP